MSNLKRHKHLFLLILFFVLAQLGCNFPYQAIGPLALRKPVADEIMQQTSPQAWIDWVEKLSGAEPVFIGGQQTIITSRYGYAMFTGQENASAFDYVLETVRGWVAEDQIEVDEYPYTDAERTYTWKNLIVTFPGTTHPEEEVVFSAHLDSIVTREGDAMLLAPGADDDATGAATLLEAVRLLRNYRFERTLRIIWFSGEEQGLKGSQAYVADHPTSGIVAAINLDMFGYDSDGDRCLELHTEVLPGTREIAVTFIDTIDTYDLNLRYDLLTYNATDRSDHASFWAAGVPAILISENFFDNNQPDGCQGGDPNPFYHRSSDTVANINLPFAFDIARASIATIANLAQPAVTSLELH